MIDERQEELAALYALGMLEPAEAEALARLLAADPELARAVVDFQAALEQLALDVPQHEPPFRMKLAVLAKIRGPAVPSVAAGGSLPVRRSASVLSWLAWAAVLALLVSVSLLLRERTALQAEVAKLQHHDAVAQLELRTLHSMLDGAPKATAVVAWDPEKQTGILRPAGLPPAGPDRDYQLWIIDPQSPAPVSAGTFRPVGNSGESISFHTGKTVREAGKFAVSLEPKGGSAQAKGPIVLMSD